MGRGKFLRSLKQRWWLLALLVLPITLGTFFFSTLTPGKYEAFMTLADRRDSSYITDPYPDFVGRAVNEQEIRVLNLANTINSYTVLKTAYDELVLNQTLSKAQVDELEFIRRIGVNPLRGTEYLQVTYVDPKPETAKSVVQTVHQKFLSRYKQLNTDAARERTTFIKQQLDEARKNYDAKLQEQKEFQEQNKGAIAFNSTISGLVGQLAQAKQRLAEAERSYEAANGQFETASRQVVDIEVNKNYGVTQNVLNPAYTEIKTRLNQSKSTLEGLRERYGEKHPQVMAIKSAIREDENLIKNTKEFYPSEQMADKSQAWQQAFEAKLQAERALGASRREMSNAQKSINEVEGKIDQLPVVEQKLTSIQAGILAESETVKNLTAKLGEAQVRANLTETPTIFMLDDPTYREVPRNTMLKTIVALFLSLIVALSLIASLGQIDQGTYTPMDAENSLGFPVIGVLPRSGQQRLNTSVEQATALAASYQILSTEIMSVKEKLAGPGILVAAAEPDAGRSTVAANLAISLARDGARVLLIDADLRSPSLHSHFALENRAGLSEILQGTATIENVVMKTEVDGLLFVAAGQPPVNPVRLFNGEGMDQFVELVSKGADYIVFDCPAGSTFGDAIVLAQSVQNVILVHEAGKSPSIAEYEFHKSIERLGVNVIGMVLNKARPEDCPAYQHFRRNYESKLSKATRAAGPSALGSGDKPVREKPQQYGSVRGDDEE